MLGWDLCNHCNPCNGYIGCKCCKSAKVEYLLPGCDLRNPRYGYIGCEGCEGVKVEYLLPGCDLCNPCNILYIWCKGCKSAKVGYLLFLSSNVPTISLDFSSSLKAAARVLSLMPTSLVKAVSSSPNLSPSVRARLMPRMSLAFSTVRISLSSSIVSF